MAMLDYLVILDLEATCDDPTDPVRQEIVEWPWLVFDLHSRTVVDHKQIFVTPQWNSNPNPPPEAVAALATDVAFANTLADAVAQFDNYLYHSFVLAARSFCLLTDGPWDLQNLLLHEAARKAVTLAPHFRSYFNLRAEYTRCYPAAPAPNDRQTMGASLNIPLRPPETGLDGCIALSAIVSRLLYDGHQFAVPDLISDYDWAATSGRIPAIADPIATAVPYGGIIRLRGLPWTCTEQHIVEFLHGIPIVPAGIHFVRNSHGKATGEAFVQLDSHDAVNLALMRHKQTMGRRYIEVFKSSPIDMSNHLGRADSRRHLQHQSQAHAHVHKAVAAAAVAAATAAAAANTTPDYVFPGSPGPESPALQYASPPSVLEPEAQAAGARSPYLAAATGEAAPAVVLGSMTGMSYVVRVVGLPRNTIPDDLLRLFDGLEMVGNGIHLVRTPDGSGCAGDAYVELTSETWAKKAVARSGFTVTTSTSAGPAAAAAAVVEVRRSSAREMRAAFSPQQTPLQAPVDTSALVPQQASVIGRGSSSDENPRDNSRGDSSSKRPGEGTSGDVGGATSKSEVSTPSNSKYFVRVRGLDDGVSVEQITGLFDSFDIGPEDVRFVKASSSSTTSNNENSSGGGGSGSDGSKGSDRVARVAFKSKVERDAALSAGLGGKSSNVGGNFVLLEDGGSNSNGRAPKSSSGSAAVTVTGPVPGSDPVCVVRMRGLPYVSFLLI